MVILKPKLETLSGPVIEIPTELGLIDLHNYADFRSLYYDTIGDLIILTWQAFDPEKFRLCNKALMRVSLIFKEIYQFNILSRDENIPKMESKNLEHLEVSLEKGMLGVNLVFNNSSQVNIKASDLELEIIYGDS